MTTELCFCGAVVSYLVELMKNALAMLGILAVLFFVLEAQRSRTTAEIRAMGKDTIVEELKTQALEARQAARTILTGTQANLNAD